MFRAPNPNLKWGNPASTPTYGHTFSDHGQKVTPAQLKDRARSLGHQVGAWTNDATAATWIAGIATQGPGAHSASIPAGLGRSYAPDGKELKADMGLVVVKPDGAVRTAYPYDSSQPT